MNKLIAVLIFFAITVVSFSVLNVKDVLSPAGQSFINGKIGSVPIKLEVANNPTTRSRGLSGRIDLKEGEGMLFVFLEPEIQGFWMKDMNFPIDIIWINEKFKIIGVEKNVSPNTFPTSFYSPAPVKYVIETPAGYFDRNSLNIGDSISLESQNLNFGGTF